METERWIVVPRWADFQHYKNRNPPWIKSYVKQVRDDEYLSLGQAERGLLNDLRMLYAEAHGQLREEAARRRLVRSESDARRWKRRLDLLNHAGLVGFSASKPLALENREQNKLSKTPSRAVAFVPNLSSYTGCRLVRGTHGTSHKRDPLGMDKPPYDWPYPKPTRAEVAAALEAA